MANILLWLLLAVVIKAAHFAVSALIVAKKGRKDVKVQYRVCQPGFEETKATSKKPKVVVFGGAGFLGRHVVRLLAERFADKLDVCVFDIQAQTYPQVPSVQFVVGDIRVPSHVRAALHGAAAVIHAAGMQETATADLSMMHEVVVDGTRNVLEACLELDVKQLIYVSSVLVHFSKSGAMSGSITEASATPPEAEMMFRSAAYQHEAERLVRAANSHVVRTTVLRVGMLLGAGDKGLVDQMFDFNTRRALRARSCSQASMLPYCWVRDAARGCVAALIRMLLPSDEDAATRAHRPWLPSAALTSSASGKSNHGNSDSEQEFVHVYSPSAEVNITKVAGKLLHLCFDPDQEDNRAAVGLSGLEDCSCEGGVILPPCPWWLLQPLAGINEDLGRRLGLAIFGRRLTQLSVHLAMQPSGLFEVQSARNVLDWQPTPWQAASRHIAAEVSSARVKQAQPVEASSSASEGKKRQ